MYLHIRDDLHLQDVNNQNIYEDSNDADDEIGNLARVTVSNSQFRFVR